MSNKEKEYSKLQIKNIDEICSVIDVNLPTEYMYNKNTTIVVFDAVNQKTEKFFLSEEQIDDINKLSDICKGDFLYDLYTSEKS